MFPYLDEIYIQKRILFAPVNQKEQTGKKKKNYINADSYLTAPGSKKDQMMQQKNIGTERARQKIKHFCSYQERSHQEVKDKLYSFGLYKDETESLLSELIEENYLNEERFAMAFSGGKFRIKKWGRIKINYELNQKKISPYCIKKGLESIDEEEYTKTLQKLFNEKKKSLTGEKNSFVIRQKIYTSLSRKGYEAELISKLLDKI